MGETETTAENRPEDAARQATGASVDGTATEARAEAEGGTAPADGAAESEPGDEPTGEYLALLIDPGYEAADENDPVPLEAIVGTWHIEADGAVRRFQQNHSYLPSNPDVPTDPVDAELRLAMRGEASAESFVAMLPGATFCIALDEQDSPIVTHAPDDQPSVLVVTSLAHAHQVTAPAWTEVTAEELAAALPDEGVDVLFNPGAPASVRLGADELRKAVEIATGTTAPPVPRGESEPVGGTSPTAPPIPTVSGEAPRRVPDSAPEHDAENGPGRQAREDS